MLFLPRTHTCCEFTGRIQAWQNLYSFVCWLVNKNFFVNISLLLSNYSKYINFFSHITNLLKNNIIFSNHIPSSYNQRNNSKSYSLNYDFYIHLKFDVGCKNRVSNGYRDVIRRTFIAALKQFEGTSLNRDRPVTSDLPGFEYYIAITRNGRV